MVEFTVTVANYDRFMGRYAVGLAPKLADAAGVRAGMRVLDVGCGPGALAVELARRIGENNVAAIDPSPEFVAACRARVPGAHVREGVEIVPSGLGDRAGIIGAAGLASEHLLSSHGLDGLLVAARA